MSSSSSSSTCKHLHGNTTFAAVAADNLWLSICVYSQVFSAAGNVEQNLCDPKTQMVGGKQTLFANGGLISCISVWCWGSCHVHPKHCQQKCQATRHHCRHVCRPHSCALGSVFPWSSFFLHFLCVSVFLSSLFPTRHKLTCRPSTKAPTSHLIFKVS